MVPINLVADLCNNAKNVGIVKQYEANIIEPLQVKKGEIDNFVDAKNEGSSIDVLVHSLTTLGMTTSRLWKTQLVCQKHCMTSIK